jgi:hypothetical protein
MPLMPGFPDPPSFYIRILLELGSGEDQVMIPAAVFAVDQAHNRFYIKADETIYALEGTRITQTITLSHSINRLVVNPVTGYLYAACCPSDPQISIVDDGVLLATRQPDEFGWGSWAIATTTGDVYVTDPQLNKLFVYDAMLEPIGVLDVAPGNIWAEPEHGWVYVFDYDLGRQLVLSQTDVISTMPGHGFEGVSPHSGYAYFQDCTVIDGLEVVATPAAHCFMGVPHIINANNGLVYRLSPNNDGVSIWQDGLEQIEGYNPDPADFSPTEVPRPGVANPQSGYVYLADTGVLPEGRVFVYRESEYMGQVLLPSLAKQLLVDSVRGWVYVACENQVVILWGDQIAAELPIGGARLLTIDPSSGLVYYQQGDELRAIVPPE